MNNKKLQEATYFVKGMHCSSCEILIEKELLKAKEIKSVEASTPKREVLIEYEGKKPNLGQLNSIFNKLGYTFYDKQNSFKKNSDNKTNNLKVFGIAFSIIAVFILLSKTGLTGFISVDSKSSLIAFFVFGILAGVSSCAALVGGIILSVSKQWTRLYSKNDSFITRSEPHLLFNLGRLISYGMFGMLLGVIGSSLQFSPTISSVLVILVSLLMLYLGLQMLGVSFLQKYQISMPKFITRYVANESHFQGRYMPFLMGYLTFFLPCGFTLTAQSLALLSGSPVQGGLMMFLFALGTTPSLLMIGLSSVKFSEKPHLAGSFLKVAAILVLFFVFFNINSQLNLLGLPSVNDANIPFSGSAKIDQTAGFQNNLTPVVDGKQIIKMEASSSGYTPDYFKIRNNIPVRFEITDVGTSGCTNAVISRGLFDGQIDLTPGKISVKEFTPQKTGRYKFSCWMGMVSGIIDVIDEKGLLNNSGDNTSNSSVISSGAQGCGCGAAKSSNGVCQVSKK